MAFLSNPLDLQNDLYITQNETFDWTITIPNVTLTGTFRIEVTYPTGVTNYSSTITTDTENGYTINKIRTVISSTVTTALTPGSYHYDLVNINGSTRTRYSHGNVLVVAQ